MKTLATVLATITATAAAAGVYSDERQRDWKLLGRADASRQKT
jgi:hypothetical protein